MPLRVPSALIHCSVSGPVGIHSPPTLHHRISQYQPDMSYQDVSRLSFVNLFVSQTSDAPLNPACRRADGELGEAWDNHTSPIQLVGFVLGLAGTLVYAQGTTRHAAQCLAVG